MIPRPVRLIQFNSGTNLHWQDANGNRLTYTVKEIDFWCSIQLRKF